MKRKILITLTAVLMAAGTTLPAHAVTQADEVVITAAKIETPMKEIGNSITVLDNKNLELSNQTMVTSKLNTVPGLNAINYGPVGQTASVFIRGAKSEDTLVLIDGIEMNDPLSPGRGYNFSNLSLLNVEKIEVLRGPQSTLYGSDAMGGVINVITKKGEGELGATAGFEHGSYATMLGTATVSGGSDLYNFTIAASRLESDGFSSASDAYDGNSEDDGYKNTTVSTRIGLTPSEIISASFFMRYTDDEADLDNFGGAFGDDPNYTSETQSLFTRLQAKLYLFDEIWEQTFGVSFSKIERDLKNDTDTSHPTDSSKSSYSGKLLKFDWQNNLYLTDVHTLSIGLETEEEAGDSKEEFVSSWGPFTSEMNEEKVRTNGYYLQDYIRATDNLFACLGVRLDDHETFGNEVTYRAAATYMLNTTKFKASYGTGFKAPSLYQLYSMYGDDDLDAETSASWEVGIEQEIGTTAMVGITYFNNKFEDLIDYNAATSKYENVDEATTNGVEVYATWQVLKTLALTPAYTYLQTEDDSTGDELLRRPEHKVSLNIDYDVLPALNLSCDIIYVGESKDLDFNTFPSERVDLDAYTLINAAATYTAGKNFEIYGRVDNITDEDYETVLGYATAGISAYVGVKIKV